MKNHAMGQRKLNPLVSATIDDDEVNDGNIRVEVSTSKSVDHWAFLEEIEAPMWADLISDVESTYQQIDDDWFNISHPFHQFSSRQLISMISLSAEVGCKNPIGGSSSPTLPPSVSKSRGKDYKSREWGKSKFDVTLSKQHPVKSFSKSSLNKQHPVNSFSKSSLVNSQCGKGINTISRVGMLQVKVGSKASSFSESSLTEATGPSHSSTMSGSTSLVCQVGESNSTSTITSEDSRPQQKKSLEVSSHIPSQATGLLTTLRTSLRRSCVTKQASRVEVNKGRKSEGCRSASSKSSVGSSSHPGCDGSNPNLTETQNKENTPESRKFMRISQAPRNKPKVLTVSKGPAAQVRVVSSNFRPGDEATTLRETIKGKAQQHSLHKKGLVSHRVNEQDHLTAGNAKKKSVAWLGTKVAVDDKRTSSRLVAVGRISYARGRADGCIGQPRKPAARSNRIGAKVVVIGNQ